MNTRTRAATSAALTIALGLSLAVPASAQPTVEIGVLECSVEGGTGFIIGSSKRLDCMFRSAGGREPYWGRINKFGLDIGSTAGGVMSWAVFAPSRDAMQPGSLTGTYAGVSGEATIGVGLGANALVGGSRRSIALQPLSVGAQHGLNLAVGVAALTLELPD